MPENLASFPVTLFVKCQSREDNFLSVNTTDKNLPPSFIYVGGQVFSGDTPRMKTIQAHHKAVKAQTDLDEYKTTIKTNAPALSSLLDALDAGETPNFLDVMAGLSQMVAFYTESDPNSAQQEGINICMSQNKCRFCC